LGAENQKDSFKYSFHCPVDSAAQESHTTCPHLLPAMHLCTQNAIVTAKRYIKTHNYHLLTL